MKKLMLLFISLLMVVTVVQPAFAIVSPIHSEVMASPYAGGRMFIYEDSGETMSGLAGDLSGLLASQVAALLHLTPGVGIFVEILILLQTTGYDQLFFIRRYYLLEDTAYATGEVDVFLYSNSDFTGLVKSYTASWYTGTPAQD